jgi:hypothetical protein
MAGDLHQRTQGQGLLQPAYQAAATFFLFLSAALLSAAQAGWFPEYTITEDYALSMELKLAGFRGRYLPEYLAVSATFTYHCSHAVSNIPTTNYSHAGSSITATAAAAAKFQAAAAAAAAAEQDDT